MIEILSVDNMRKSDAAAIKTKVTSKELMARAGRAVFENVKWQSPVLVVAGSGNNAGDGFVLASLLASHGFECHILILSNIFSGDSNYFFNLCKEEGIKIFSNIQDVNLSYYKIIVDCIFGTGFRGEVSDSLSKLIHSINYSGAYIVSVDINSGLNGDNGLGKIAITSHLTISISHFKPGHFLNMAKDCIKEKINCDIGIKPIEPPYHLFEKKDAKMVIKERKNFSNKSSYGYIVLVGGSLHYPGAIKLTHLANCAMTSGAGVTTLAFPKQIIESILPNTLESTLFPLKSRRGFIRFSKSQMETLIKRADVITYGMGLGMAKGVNDTLSYLLSSKYTGTLILDADGLNALSQIGVNFLLNTKARVILTPHLRELSRLTGLTDNQILEKPIPTSMEFAKKYNCILLLKGPTTIITNGTDVLLVDKGSPGMATAGSGDVLSGILSAICGYSKDNLLNATATAAFINGLAGEIAEKNNSDVTMTSKDTIASIKQVFLSLTN